MESRLDRKRQEVKSLETELATVYGAVWIGGVAVLCLLLLAWLHPCPCRPRTHPVRRRSGWDTPRPPPRSSPWRRLPRRSAWTARVATAAVCLIWVGMVMMTTNSRWRNMGVSDQLSARLRSGSRQSNHSRGSQESRESRGSRHNRRTRSHQGHRQRRRKRHQSGFFRLGLGVCLCVCVYLCVCARAFVSLANARLQLDFLWQA